MAKSRGSDKILVVCLLSPVYVATPMTAIQIFNRNHQLKIVKALRLS